MSELVTGHGYHRATVRAAPAPAHAATRRLDSDLAAVAALVVVGAVLAVLDDASPVGVPLADGLWRAALGALVVACSAFGTPVAAIVSATLAAAGTSDASLITVGVVAIGAATLGASRFPELHAFGAAAGLGVSWVVFRLPYDQFLGVSTLVALVIVAPVVASAWYWGPVLLVQLIGWLTTLLALVAVVGGGGLALAAYDARSELNQAADLVDDALRAFRDGDEQRARELLAEGVDALHRADDAASKPWLQLNRAVPGLGQHATALQRISSHGVDTGVAALDVLDDLDQRSLTIRAGRVDVAAVRSVEPTVVGLATTAEEAHRRLSEARSPWLIGPMARAVDDATAELDGITRSARRAADAVSLAPAMLGADDPRAHLVLFATPAELRGSGGLVGNWALIAADGGALRLAGVGRVEDLNRSLAGVGVTLTRPAGYVAHYGAYSIETEFQDITLSPNYPDVAAVAAQLFEAAEGIPVDTVMLVDPDAIAALLRLTGPVTVGERTLTAATARDFLLLGQYEELDDEAERVAFLERLLERTFSRLLAVDFPDPWDLDEIFAEVVAEDRLVLSAIDPEEQALLLDLGIGGSFPQPAGDLLGVVTQNGGQNKIDTFLQRHISYDADLDPATGRIDATVTVELTNLVSDLSLPEAVVGNNDQGYDLGTNVSLLTVYSPHRLVGASVDGEEVGFRAADELGVRAYSRLVEIPAGTTVVAELRLEDVLDLSERYLLDVPVQPAVSPDTFDVRISVPPSASIGGDRGPWTWSVTTSADARVEVPVDMGR